MNDAMGLLVFFGGGLSLLMAGVDAMRKHQPLQTALQTVIGFLLLEFFLTHAAGFTADMATHPVQTGAFLIVRCSKYALGPLFYMFYLELTTYRPVRWQRAMGHFVTLGLAWLLSLAYMGASLARLPAFQTLRAVMGLVTDVSLIHMMGYIVFALMAARLAGHRKAVAVLQAAAVVGGTTLALMALYLATGWKALEFAAMALLSVAMVLLFLYSQLRPDGLEHFGKEARGKTYQRSTLKGVDTELLGLRLKDLMEKDKVFTDEQLTLDTLAERLSVPRNRLSEFLNGVLHTTFNAYVNGYRIEEVKRLLREPSQHSILSHAFSAGFNSKSVFYDAFRKATGMTPQAYRDSVD